MIYARPAYLVLEVKAPVRGDFSISSKRVERQKKIRHNRLYYKSPGESHAKGNGPDGN